ncbi:MAG TPA: hypothetical protein VIT67_11870 [Povalibacter sp.]
MQPDRLRKDLPGATESRPMPLGPHDEFGDSLSPEELEAFEDLEDYYASLDDDDSDEDEDDENRKWESGR